MLSAYFVFCKTSSLYSYNELVIIKTVEVINMRRSICKYFSSQYIAALTLISVFLFAGVAQAGNDEDVAFVDRFGKAFATVAREVAPAVVHVRVEKEIENRNGVHGQDPFGLFNDPFFEHFFGPGFRQPQPNGQGQTPYKQRGAGSGFIISDDGYILTNNHVVGDADTITVSLDDKREFKAKVIGSDAQSDVALIKIEGKNLPTVSLGDSDQIEVGEWVIAIGSPFELNQTVTVGVVSAKGRNRIGINDYENFIQTDAAINPGNSGGPLLDIHGRVIGINTAIFSRSGGYMGIGFAIPINMVKSIQQQLMSAGKVTRGWLGVAIQDVDRDLATSFQLDNAKGVLLTDVSEGTPADKAGLKQGDVLLSMDGVELGGAADLRNRVAMIEPGRKVNFILSRDGKRKNIVVTIGEQPADFGRIAKQRTTDDDSSLNSMGLSLQNLNRELADKFGYKTDQGVLVAGVTPGSVAEEAGIKPGHLIEELNRQRVHNLKDLQNVLKNSGNSQQVLLRVRAGEYSRYLVLRLK
ncbi:periplasmic serine protease, Do/DeqQ family [Desulfocapsa sulfexigens DSM 10523]|uniref:Probable periplasmic serine endoprotease DegP-like n=2 Tax=Desulfocapsa TaxID=53318 RepID=M1P8X1_DESSD|nr:periplasmic serine protease, Do/DeqQ family [Desulfocapsa sulfexigens DSM 10523]